MIRWILLVLAVILLVVIYPLRIARPLYFFVAWGAMAAGRAAAKDEEQEAASAPLTDSDTPSDSAARGPNDLHWTESRESEGPHFNFPQDPASSRGAPGDLHWFEDGRDSAGTDKG